MLSFIYKIFFLNFVIYNSIYILFKNWKEITIQKNN